MKKLLNLYIYIYIYINLTVVLGVLTKDIDWYRRIN